MVRWWALLLLSCAPPIDVDESPSDDPALPLGVVRGCAALALGDDVIVEIAAPAATLISLHVERADGSVVAAPRFEGGGQRAVTIAADLFALGRNELVVSAYRTGARSEERRLVFFAHAVDAARSREDHDGDCFSPAMGDCNDALSAVHPAAAEVCGDGADNDCDGSVDDGCASCADADGDGFGALSCGGTDCDDTTPALSPTAAEVCDSIDNDCDGEVDELFDGDGDGYARCVPDAPLFRRVDGSWCSGECHDCDDSDALATPASGCAP